MRIAQALEAIGIARWHCENTSSRWIRELLADATALSFACSEQIEDGHVAGAAEQLPHVVPSDQRARWALLIGSSALIPALVGGGGWTSVPVSTPASTAVPLGTNANVVGIVADGLSSCCACGTHECLNAGSTGFGTGIDGVGTALSSSQFTSSPFISALVRMPFTSA